MEYRCQASTIGGFVQQLAVCYVARGYWHYFYGQIPKHKDPQEVDKKLIQAYGIDWRKWARHRRKKEGYANLQYIRYQYDFVLVATHGQHEFFQVQKKSIKNVKKNPILFRGYSISFRNNRVQVAIDTQTYRNLKAYLVDISTKRPAHNISAEFQRIQFEPYGPVLRQMYVILRQVNQKRKTAGLDQISPKDCIHRRRTMYLPFD